MNQWTVILKDKLGDVQRGEVKPGGEVSAIWANISGAPKAAIWIICPKCGTVGHCPANQANPNGANWTVTEEDGKLTMRPSILCNSTIAINAQGKVKRSETPCGGHYWLTAGVLQETN